MAKKESAEKAVRDIRRKTRRRFPAEEKIRIVIEGLRGEESIASLCRREGIAANLYYRWSKEFLEAGKKRLLGDTHIRSDYEDSKAAQERGATKALEVRADGTCSKQEHRLGAYPPDGGVEGRP
jgi:transposase